MAVGHWGHPPKAGTPKLGTPFCRARELTEVIERLHSPLASAIFLSSDPGLGATTLLHELAASLTDQAAVMSIQGTPSLAGIPFGILAPYLKRNADAYVESHVDAIRKMLALLEEQEHTLRTRVGPEARVGVPVLIIDEADYIDSATAGVAVGLAQGGKIKLVVAYRSTNEPVDPLPQLWNAGLAEKVHLRPLTRAEGHEFCVAALGGPATVTTSWHFWNSAGGNPLLMRLVMAEAFEAGKLRWQEGLWSVDMHLAPPGRQLQQVVEEQLRGLSASAREALNLLALSEPMSVATMAGLVGHGPVHELLERHLAHETAEGSGLLRLINPVYGEVIRGMVPRAQSLVLHHRLIHQLDVEPTTPESLLRRVIWALDSGQPVPDDSLLRAATYACKLYESAVAIRLAEEIKGPDHVGRARIVKARAEYNVGDYEAALKLLENSESDGFPELLFGGLLHAATKSALGLPVESIHADAARLRAMAQDLASQGAGGPDGRYVSDMVWRAREKADVLDLMAHSRAGRYAEMEPHIQNVLSNTSNMENFAHRSNRSIALAMDAERLSSLGFPMQGRMRAAEAFSITQAEDQDVYFLPEMIVSRAQAASLAAGEWGEAEQILATISVDVGRSTVSFGGSVGVARGMILLRQGRYTDAVDELMQGLDALQLSDPQQLFGYCTAMAAYAAACSGRAELAGQLAEQYREDPGMHLVVSHGAAFMAAAREHLAADGSGVAELLRLADDAAERGLRTPELNALSLVLDFEPTKGLERMGVVARQVEGPWAAGLAAYAGALEDRNAATAVAAGEQLLETQMYQHAGRAFRFATSLMGRSGDGRVVRRVREGLERVTEALGVAEVLPDGKAEVHDRVRDLLTRRELEIVTIAATGASDKDIAEQLHLSVRTVEGHLYRSYAKLGITARDELALVLAD